VVEAGWFEAVAFAGQERDGRLEMGDGRTHLLDSGAGRDGTRTIRQRVGGAGGEAEDIDDDDRVRRDLDWKQSDV
jgi:hypothetical protein